jgi:hypothetical protein
LLTPGEARAQIRVAPLELARFHVGQLELTPTFEVTNLGIDNNVFNDSRNRRDANLIVSPGLRAFLPVGRRLRLGGNGRVDFGWFPREGGESYADVRGASDAELDLGPVTLIAGASGGRQRQRFSIEIDDRILRESHELRGGAGVTLGARTVLVLEGFEGRLRFDPSTAQTPARGEEIQQALDRDTVGGRAELRYRLTEKTTFVARGERQEDDFASSPQPESGARRWRMLGGFDFSPTALVSGRLQAGLVVVPEDEGQVVPPYQGLALDVTLSRRLSWFGELRVDARRDVAWAVSRGFLEDSERRNSFVDERASAQLSLGLPLDAILRTTVAGEQARFLLPVVQRGRELSRRDRRVTVQGALLWPIGKYLRLGLNALWARRSSNLAGVGYEGWRYGLAAEFVP